MDAVTPAHPGAEAVGRSYTRARRFPLVIGQLPGGGRIIGGPYTLSQIAVMAAAVVALYLSTPVWAHLGYGNAAVFVLAPYALSWCVRHARMEGREPLRAGAGALAAVGAPSGGRLRGRGHRAGAPVLVRAAVFAVHDAAGGERR